MQNFWEKSGWEDGDKHLIQLKKSPFLRPFPPIKLGGPALFIIRGPRQIGKSTWLKSILKELPAEQSFFLSCDNLRDHLELAELFKAQAKKKYILLDEINFVEEWWRAVKHFADSNTEKTLIITGSHTADLKKGADLMPGRFDRGGEIELLPMDFTEFVEMREQAGWPVLDRTELLRLYFRIGGFPHALIESGPEGKEPYEAQSIYQRWLLGDLLKLGKQEQYLKELLGQMALTMSSPISLQKLSQRTQIASHQTAQSYVETLESCFALSTLYAINPETNTFHMKKQKKFYFRDPLIYWIALSWSGLSVPQNSESVVAEMVANEHLKRGNPRYGYFSNRQGEVDFLAPDQWAVEVKWSDESYQLSKAYKTLKVPFKTVWNKNNFLEEFPSSYP